MWLAYILRKHQKAVRGSIGLFSKNIFSEAAFFNSCILNEQNQSSYAFYISPLKTKGYANILRSSHFFWNILALFYGKFIIHTQRCHGVLSWHFCHQEPMISIDHLCLSLHFKWPAAFKAGFQMKPFVLEIVMKLHSFRSFDFFAQMIYSFVRNNLLSFVLRLACRKYRTFFCDENLWSLNLGRLQNEIEMVIN